MKRIIYLLLAFLFFNTEVFSQIQADGYFGDLWVGAVTDSSTSVDFLLRKTSGNHIYHATLYNVTQGVEIQASEINEYCLDDTCIYTCTFSGLTPDNYYHARLYEDNILIDSTRSDFYLPGSNITDFSFIIGSGAHLYPQGDSRYERERIYEHMATEPVNFVIWLGDNIYLPYENLVEETVYKQYLFYKTESPRRNLFLKNFFHFGIWDDHDCGYNNATKDFFNIDFTSEMYKIFWPNSTYTCQGPGDVKGVYRYEDCDFFMTDSRWYRTRYSYLGKSQMDWLKEQLLHSTATFKFVLLGTATIYPWSYSTPAEVSMYFTGERDELINFIYEHNIKGVILLTGDKHKSYFAQYKPDCNSTYPIYEFMSSAFSSNPNTSTYNYADILTQFSQNSYGVIEVSGPAGNRVCTMTAKDTAGNVIYSISINEHELEESSQPDINPDDYITAKYDFSGNANDNSGNSNDGTVNGATLSYDRWGNNNSAYLFNSYPNTINFPNSILDGKNDFTISLWIKPTTHGVGILSASSSTEGNEVLIYYKANKKISFNIQNVAIYSTDTVKENEWTHIVVTRNGTTGEAKIYLNGEIQSRGTLPTGPIEVVSNALLIGNDQDGGGGGNLDENQQFKGIIDDVVFYDTVLCQKQIKELYEQGLEKVVPITNDTICGPGQVDFVVSGASNGHYKWYKTKEGNSLVSGATDSVLSTYITESTTYWVSADNFWMETERQPVTITVAPKIYTDHDSLTYPSELVYWASFDGDSHDETGNFPNAIVNGPTLTTGRFGNPNSAYEFTSYPNTISIPHEVIDGAEEITISFWMKTTSSSDGIVSAASSEGGNELLIYLNSDGTLEVTMNEYTRNYTSPVVNDNMWHHILFTAECDSGEGKLYVDGQRAIEKNDYFWPGELEVPAGAFIIGNDQDDPGGGGLDANQQFNGVIDDFKVYRRVLTDKEVQDIYNDNVKFKEPFNFSWNSLQLCSGSEFVLNLTPTQSDVTYFLLDNGMQPQGQADVSNDTAVFNVVVNNDNEFMIEANNAYNCPVYFDSTFAVHAVQTPTPNIVEHGSDTICSDVQADNYYWFFNGSQLPYNQQCIPLTNEGDYNLVVMNYPDCYSDTSVTYTYINTFTDNVNDNGLTIYPVPVNDHLSVKLSEFSGEADFVVINNSGKTVLSGKIKENPQNIDVSGLPKGVYLIRLHYGDETLSKVFQKM